MVTRSWQELIHSFSIRIWLGSQRLAVCLVARATPSLDQHRHCSYVCMRAVLSRITAAKDAIRGACAVWCCLVTAVVLSLLVPVHSLLIPCSTVGRGITTHTRRCLKSLTAARSLVVRMSVSVSSLPRMEGELFCFHQDQFSKRVGFRSGSKAHKRHVVLVGGLSDGLLPVPYTQQLGQALDTKGWALVQVLLSSSYTGFGHVRLDDDARELEQLMQYLQEEGSEALGIVGHSTGCQDAVYYLKQHHAQDRLKFIALQAPVSDRESMELMLGKDKMAQLVSIARAFKEEGNGHEMMPRGAFWAPITAQRFLDLATKEGLDDMFSSDLTPEELSQRLGHVNVPTLLAFSAKDEYVPFSVDVPQLAARMKAAMPHAQPCTITHIEGAGHALKGHEDQFVTQLLDFMTQAGLITT